MPRAVLAIAGVGVAWLLVWQLLVTPWRDPNRLRLPPQQQVSTAVPILGVHTRLTDEVEQSKIRRTLEMVRRMGAQWDVEYFPWNYVQRHGVGEWDWTHADLVVDHAQRQGLKLIARLDSVPVWARPRDTAYSYLDPSHYADFGNFVYQFVRRYRGKVAAYVIWNEPNVSYEWGVRPPDPEAYAQLLKVAYQRAKQADSQAVVLAAPLAPTLEKSNLALDDLDYLDRLYDAGAAPYFDGLAAHTYGWRNPPDQAPSAGAVNLRRVELLRQVMVRHGDGGKMVYVTETGWNDYPRWIRAVSPSQRTDYTVEAVRLAQSWPWLAAFCIWEFRLPTVTHTYNDAWYLVRTDFSPTPVYLALRRLAAGNASVKVKREEKPSVGQASSLSGAEGPANWAA
ncbi:MAG: hypothetical protein KGJ86_04355 [Chloroflexota bacterium]|nr:hypothetical protein [Chloroflexota bacterium]